MQTKELDNLGLITGLMSLGYPPVERRREGKKVYFIFEWDENMEQLESDYFNGRMGIPDAQNYHTTQKAIKTSIYRSEDNYVRE
jgi:hypothetical protein